ncbi:hypothetical protein HOB30_01435 [Candidatus Falkowbacteria bacterium]|nr:hypothetical protein [Candidatus Falkowbacteria bacterium]
MSKNIDLIAKLAQMLQEGKDIEEIEVSSWGWGRLLRKLRVKKSPRILAPAPSVVVEAPPEIIAIKAGLVGTFYYNNDKPLTVGDEIKSDDVVGIITALKLENNVESEITGKIIAVEVEDGQIVEYGQVLFKVELT